MAKQLITTHVFLMIHSFSFNLYGQTKTNQLPDNFTIDPKIETEVKKYISKSELSDTGEKAKELIYNNRIIGEFYQNDKLIFSSEDSTERNLVFKSFYYWQNDTLVIDGAFGLFTGIGFSLKIHNGKTTLYHMVASDETPGYAYKESDTLTYRLEIPCTETKTILSEIPDSTKKQMIYGYVEFTSSEYYETIGSVDGKEFLPRIKDRVNMKIYFRSISIPFY